MGHHRLAGLPVLTGLAAAVAFAAAVTTGAQQAPPAPTFRAAVDVIAVDAQVVDGTGHPIPALDRDQFEVTIDGRKRRVVSANLVQAAPILPDGRPDDSKEGAGRTFILAIDAGSFTPSEQLPVLTAAKE